METEGRHPDCQDAALVQGYDWCRLSADYVIDDNDIWTALRLAGTHQDQTADCGSHGSQIRDH